MLKRECVGCSPEGRKAVLEVVENRMRIDKKTACQVIRSSSFPWSKKQKDWKFTENQLTDYFKLRMMTPVVGKFVYYFNNSKFVTFGRFCCKIEDHYFYYRT